MNVKASLIAGMTLVIAGSSAHAAESPSALTDQTDKVSYSVGVNIGSNLKHQGMELKPELVAAGLKDALAGGKLLLTDQQVQEALMSLQRQMVGKQAELGEKNKKDGETFLADNKKKPGVKTLPSGLQYQVIKEGKGEKPKAADTVKANYKGTLIDGTEFDSSEKHGEAATFPLNGVIPGWTEALQLMPVGSKWRLFIPSELAYGERGAGGLIGPNATLVFDVELLGVEKGETGPKK